MRRLLSIIILAAVCGVMIQEFSNILTSDVHAGDWKQGFDDICRKTSDPVSLSQDDLRQLISRCDTLKTVIETLDETEKKVYLKRLRTCRDLFVFVLESKEKPQ